LRLFLRASSQLSSRMTSPSILVDSFIENMFNSLPLRGDSEISLGHVIGFHPNPALLTFEANGGIGRALLLQGYPTSPANMVYAACSGVCLPILRTLPLGQSTTGQPCASVTSRCARDFHPLARCAAKRTSKGTAEGSSFLGFIRQVPPRFRAAYSGSFGQSFK
jgi:hypothetical protein